MDRLDILLIAVKRAAEEDLLARFRRKFLIQFPSFDSLGVPLLRSRRLGREDPQELRLLGLLFLEFLVGHSLARYDLLEWLSARCVVIAQTHLTLEELQIVRRAAALALAHARLDRALLLLVLADLLLGQVFNFFRAFGTLLAFMPLQQLLQRAWRQVVLPSNIARKIDD